MMRLLREPMGSGEFSKDGSSRLGGFMLCQFLMLVDFDMVSFSFSLSHGAPRSPLSYLSM